MFTYPNPNNYNNYYPNNNNYYPNNNNYYPNNGGVVPMSAYNNEININSPFDGGINGVIRTIGSEIRETYKAIFNIATYLPKIGG